MWMCKQPDVRDTYFIATHMLGADPMPFSLRKKCPLLALAIVLIALVRDGDLANSTALGKDIKPRAVADSGQVFPTQVTVTWMWYGKTGQQVSFKNPFGGVMRLEVIPSEGQGIAKFWSDIDSNDGPAKSFIYATNEAWILLSGPRSGTATAIITPHVPQKLPGS
jgi:hypothetical protein